MRLKKTSVLFTDGNWIESKDQSTNEIRLLQTGNIGKGIFLDKSDRAKYISEETFKRLKCTEVLPGDLIISRLPDPIGRACIVPNSGQKMITAVDCTIYRINPELVSKEYANYFLMSNLYFHQITNNVKGTTRKRISRKNLENIEFPITNKSTQNNIVEKLNLVRRLIDIYSKELTKLDKLIKARFVEMFGDLKFDTSLSFYVNSLVAGKSLAGKQESPNKVLNTGAVSYDYFRNDSKNLPLDYVPLEKNQIQTSDLLISRMNTQELVGAVAYVWEAPKHTYLPDRLWKAKLKDNVNPIFIWQALIYPLSKIQIRRMATGTSGSMKNISKNNFLAVKIPYAKIQKQNEFANFVQQVDKSKFENIVYLNKTLSMKILSQLGDVSRD